jgi:hypothetical protein
LPGYVIKRSSSTVFENLKYGKEQALLNVQRTVQQIMHYKMPG